MKPAAGSGVADHREIRAMADVVLSILAHPDDAEFLCAGTLIRLVREHGWQAHIASMTPGDCGSAELPAQEISRIRRGEGAKAASLIGASYHCLEERDLLVFYNERALERVTRLLRAIRPRVLLTHSPADYMLDHEMTSTLARAAAFAAPVPNFLREQGHGLPLEHIPHLYYCDAVQGKDLLGRPVAPEFAIDISSVIDSKAAMLAAHASQRDWLLKHHGMDQYLQAMREWGARWGQAYRVAYAEGFRQHRGHSYPQDNLLGNLLGMLRSTPMPVEPDRASSPEG
jgi:N-acetylglucosamine malate deacetylase 1